MNLEKYTNELYLFPKIVLWTFFVYHALARECALVAVFVMTVSQRGMKRWFAFHIPAFGDQSIDDVTVVKPEKIRKAGGAEGQHAKMRANK